MCLLWGVAARIASVGIAVAGVIAAGLSANTQQLSPSSPQAKHALVPLIH